MSKDSLRKHVSSTFGKGMASHSLRKGGAVFYSRRGAAEDATRQQGGWKTSEVMQRIYSTLSKEEVKDQILAVGRSTSIHHELHLRLGKIGDSPDKALTAPVAAAISVLTLIERNLDSLSTRVLFDTSAPKYLRAMFKHADAGVRDRAAHLHATLHANWMSQQADKRRKLK